MGSLNHTVSGNVASFRTPSRVPIESLKLHFLPKQEGSGDPSPTNTRPITGWTGLNVRRTHKNIIKPRYAIQETKNDLTITPTLNGIKVKGTASARTACFLAGTDILSLDLGKKYTFSLYLNGDISECENPFIGYYTSQYVFGASIGSLSTTNGYVKQWTVPSGYANASAPHIDSYIYVPSGIAVDFEIGLQMEVGESATSYEPYSEEQIPITFPTNGKNLVNDETTTPRGWTSRNGHRYTNTKADTRGYVALSVQQIDKDNNIMQTLSKTVSSTGRTSITFTALSGCNQVMLKHNGKIADLGIYIPWDGKLGTYTISANFESLDISTVGGFVFSDVQIELGDTMTSYELYSSDNTFYGGYIDPVAGEIVAEYAFKVCDGSEQWSSSYTSESITRFHTTAIWLGLPQPINNSTTFAKFSYFKSYSSLASWNGFIGSTGNILFYVPSTTASTVTEWKAYLSEHNLQICYKFAGPIHIPISPQAIKAYLDYNNFWSDANDITEVTYPITESKDILATRQKFMANEPHIASVTPASVAHFETDMKVPLTSLKVYFEPWMNGYGDPTPTNIREIQGHIGAKIKMSGKNMLKCETNIDGQGGNITYAKHMNENNIVDYITVTGDNDRNNLFRNLTVASRNGLPRGILSFNSFSDQANIMPIRQGGMPSEYTGRYFLPQDGGGISASRTGWFDWDITKYDQWQSWVRIQIYPNGGPGTINTIIYPMMCHPSDRGCNFEPYRGQDYQITFPAIKNLLNPTSENVIPFGQSYSNYTLSNGCISPTGNVLMGFKVPCRPSTQYTFQFKTSMPVAFRVAEFEEEPTQLTNGSNYIVNTNSTDITYRTFVTSSTGHWLVCGFYLKNSDIISGETISDFQLELGSSTTAYEPYGTVYGGYIDLITGQLMKSWHKFRVKDASWTYKAGNHRFQMQLSSNLAKAPISGWTRFAMSDCYKRTDSTNGYSNKEIATFGNNYIYIRDDTYESADDFVEAMGDAEIIYELAEPTLVYQFTPQQIKTFIGTNNIWSDLNGNVEVEYWTH